MIDQFSEDGTGWARFSDDMTMRYRLGRALNGRPITTAWSEIGGDGSVVTDAFMKPIVRVTFLMLNPSTADAFKVDPTIKRCMAFARAWGADVLEVANIFALRSTDPGALYKLAHGQRGDDMDATSQMLDACRGAARVVAGWGTHGALDHRGVIVRDLLLSHDIRLCHLGQNKDASPKHPLYLKGGTEPQEWL